ncbi:Glucosaminyl phosphatidylinositol (GlcN-PI) nositol acylation protein [Exophiala xenobiotica]|uniref:GPI-anchored wall transfer protein n=1 Tax=Vermiconidia calcicola TaxID=1690605 RepID=A0AAV9Q0G5_9PEZI|nr:Glucosaminyl phosphatidylinositol (GlcN-PI) nositol acylation protein [Exophiala xenobiotica]KAK5531048.1 Glucosaminyl phosphatidylinositol (GlcN-PI) nositol acylation protein [Vermiconidia calcicola]KAK5536299.1 Glucosaminyl phosphatidylinositol (GlcN-PI) nositol acylation protein [Chaetothyriales sp. CCFEE 6169]KAK5294472.1 Glucosaminyl phosphatidylinositol (GlcN-PI) nositol acylation protein [Exophiala xenobiotica]KAK5337504.1 Glucosaminyl phosphatidylinositol (GlcN-PI) nositol acylation 
MTPQEAASYKSRKEAFVSNLSGSSLNEINLVTLVASAAVLLWTVLQKRQSFFTPHTPISLTADFLLNVCGILFAITLYSSAPLVLSIFLITPSLLLFFLTSAPSNSSSSSTTPSSKPPKAAKASPSSSSISNASSTAPTSPATATLPVRPFLTHYRGSMMIATCLSILAVDFRIFPRRFAKVETWGTSLMDLGVGSFVFSAGVVSARALVKLSSSSSSSSTTTTTAAVPSGPNFTNRFLISIRHSLPLLLLGLIRLYSVKNLDYAEHVTEYGVHWNFFFTLALLPPFVEISDTITRHLPLLSYDVLSVLLSLIYEIALNEPRLDLLRYILISPRGPDWLSKNREGVFSFIGYLAIFLAGRGTGTRVIRFSPPSPSPHSRKSRSGTGTDDDDHASLILITRQERRLVLRALLTRALIYSALFLLSTHVYACNLDPSRRLANLPYVLWISAFNNAQLLLFGLVEHCGPSFSYAAQDRDKVRHFATSRILRVFNTNGLAVFLVANLLTGLVNLTMNTLDTTALGAMVVLIIYAAVLTGFALGLDYTGVKIKI